MNREGAGGNREIVIPGDLLDASGLKAGSGAYAEDGRVFAAQLGIKSVKSNFVNVIPLGGRYIPATGDSVIGKVIDIGPSNWLIDINSPYPAPLHVNEVPWRVEFGDTSKYLNVGDTLLAKILMVDETKRVQVTMKEQGLRKLSGGQVIDISYCKVPRVIGNGRFDDPIDQEPHQLPHLHRAERKDLVGRGDREHGDGDPRHPHDRGRRPGIQAHGEGKGISRVGDEIKLIW
jgi:exosome complex component RRP4